jgi:N-formylmaleamate deformylase
MTQWLEDSLIVNGASIHYRRSEGQHPSLVMLHGFTDSGRDCEVFARAFVDDYDVILVDERGHGLSSATPANYSLSDQADDMAGLIMGLGLSKPAVYGHSIGAVTAVQMAFQYPDLLSTIILEDPPIFGTPPDDDRSGWKTSLAAFKQRPYEEQLAEAMRNQAHWHEDENKAWVESKNQFQMALFEAPVINKFLEWRNIGPHLTIPGLLIIGDPSLGAIVTAEIAKEFQSLWPSLQIAPIEKAGHSIRRDQPEAVTQIVRQYLIEYRN